MLYFLEVRSFSKPRSRMCESSPGPVKCVTQYYKVYTAGDSILMVVLMNTVFFCDGKSM